MPDHDVSTSGVPCGASQDPAHRHVSREAVSREGPSREALRQALRAACDKAGGQKPLAERIGTTQSMVWYWLERARRGVPAEYVLLIEAATGISRHALRPDIFPLPADAIACEHPASIHTSSDPEAP